MKKNNIKTHIISLVFKGLCTLFIVTVLGLLIWRMFSMNVPNSMKTIIATDEIQKVYNEKNGELTLFTQDQDIITRAEKNSGYFSVPMTVFVEDTNQVQLVFRYNNSTIKHTREDYMLPKLPQKSDMLYDVSLVIVYDLTPEDDSDNLITEEGVSTHSERIHPNDKYTQSYEKNLYNFRKYVFDNVQTGDDVLAIYVDFYYIEDIDYDKEAYGTLCIYDYITPKETYKLTNKDIKEIEK